MFNYKELLQEHLKQSTIVKKVNRDRLAEELVPFVKEMAKEILEMITLRSIEIDHPDGFEEARIDLIKTKRNIKDIYEIN